MPPPPTKENVLDLDVRRQIVEHVVANPGVHLRAIAEALGFAVSTVEYHCHQLVRHDHLSSRDDGGLKAFYPAHGLDRRDKDVLNVVRHRAPRRICAHLILHPGATPKDLKPVVGVSGATLSFHLKRMREAGILHEEPAGRTKKLSLADPERVASVLVTYKKSFVDDAVDAFAETWLMMDAPRRQEGTDQDDAAEQTDGVEETSAAKKRPAADARDPPDAEGDGADHDGAAGSTERAGGDARVDEGVAREGDDGPDPVVQSRRGRNMP